MARLISTGVAIITLAVTAFSQDPWVRYESEVGRYSVLIPAEQLAHGSRRVSDDNGSSVILNSIALFNGVTRYIVTYYDTEPSMSFSLTRARDGIVRQLNGKLVSDTSARILGVPSRTFRVHKITSGHEITVNARIFFTGSRVYLLQVIFPRSLENTVAEDRARWFFNSFLITNPQAK
jgi:hypothetical protein